MDEGQTHFFGDGCCFETCPDCGELDNTNTPCRNDFHLELHILHDAEHGDVGEEEAYVAGESS